MLYVAPRMYTHMHIYICVCTHSPPQAPLLKKHAWAQMLVFIIRILKKSCQNHLILPYPFTLAGVQNNKPPRTIQNNINFRRAQGFTLKL